MEERSTLASFALLYQNIDFTAQQRKEDVDADFFVRIFMYVYRY